MTICCLNRERRRDSVRAREKDRRPRDEMDWEDGSSRRPTSREREGQRARSSGPGSSLPDDREREKDSGGKRQADTDVEMERRSAKVNTSFSVCVRDHWLISSQKSRLSEHEGSKREDTPEEGEI
jgi:pre-mRNA-processing factor 40